MASSISVGDEVRVVKMVIYFGGVSLVFILQLNIYSEKGEEPKRMLGDYFESSGKL
jgi:hypothetical protein